MSTYKIIRKINFRINKQTDSRILIDMRDVERRITAMFLSYPELVLLRDSINKALNSNPQWTYTEPTEQPSAPIQPTVDQTPNTP